MANEKTNRVIQVDVNHSIREMTIRVVGVESPLVFHADRAHEANQVRAQMLGFKNRIVDAAAKSRDESTGLSATPKEKYDSMAAIIKHLESGAEDWGVRVARVSSSDDSLLVMALMEVTGADDRAKVAATVKSWSPAKRNAVRVREDVKTVLDRMIAASAEDVDTDELLNELI